MPSLLRHRWVTFAAMSLIFFVVSAGAFSSLGVVLPAMVKELHWNWTEAGLGYTLLGIACGLASFLPAVTIRNIGVRGTMLLGALLLVSGFAAMALTQSVGVYLLATVLIGLAFAFVSTVPGTHMLTDLFQTRRPTILGAYFTLGALGGVAGPQIFKATDALTHAWRPYWWTFVAMAVVSGLFAVLTTPNRREPEAHARIAPEQLGPSEVIEHLKDWTVRRALLTPQFYLIVGGYTTYLLINTTTHGFAVQHLMEHGVSLQAASDMLSLEALVGACIGLVGGLAGEKVSPKFLMILSLVGVTLGTWGLAQAHGWGMMMLYVLGVGLGFGLSFISSTMLLLTYFGKRPNLELYSIMCMISTTAALGPALGGWARDTLGSFWGMFMACAGLTLILLVATLFMQPPVIRPSRPTEPVPGGAL